MAAQRQLGLTICLNLVFLSCFSGDPRCTAQSPTPSPQPSPSLSLQPSSQAPSSEPSVAPSPELSRELSFRLLKSELAALKAIAGKLKIGPETWNFSLDPCNGWPKEVRKSPAVTKELNCTCNATTKSCHVVSISLKSTNLVGELPDEEFANLTHLATLDLTRNYINGSIPTTWAKLPLVKIDLVGNRLGGEIPKEIGNISTLESIVLDANLFRGRIPASLGNLGNLKRLLLSNNNFSGELPNSLGKLTNLTDFRIDGTGISGKFPSFVGNWTLLSRLDMQGTSLEGPFPPTLSALTKLKQLRVSDFKGDGEFPSLESMTSLERLYSSKAGQSG